MVRALVRETAWHLDRAHHMDVSDRVSMCNYRANRLACEAADRAIQVHGGIARTLAEMGFNASPGARTAPPPRAAAGSPPSLP